MRPARLVLPALPALLLASACSGGVTARPVAMTTSAVTTSAAASTTAPSSSALPASSVASPSATGTPPCADGQVVVSTGFAGVGLGHGGFVLLFRDTAEPCTLTGYPVVHLVRQDGSDAGTVEQTPSGYLGGGDPSATVTIEGGTLASALVEGLNDPSLMPGTPCVQFASITVTPPGTTRPVPVAGVSGPCFLEVHPVVAGDRSNPNTG